VKGALQQSWDEVQHLRYKCADYDVVNAQLEEELKRIKEDQDMWRIRCIAVEEAVLQSK